MPRAELPQIVENRHGKARIRVCGALAGNTQGRVEFVGGRSKGLKRAHETACEARRDKALFGHQAEYAREGRGGDRAREGRGGDRAREGQGGDRAREGRGGDRARASEPVADLQAQ
jgi:hypothetical protein